MPITALRPLSLGEALDASLGLYRQRFGQLLGVSFATQAVPLALSMYIDSAGGPFFQVRLELVDLALAILLGAVGTAASTFLISEWYLGRSMTTGQALNIATRYLGRLISYTFASGLLIGVGFFFLAVPGIILFSGLIVGTPALVIENLPTATQAMRRSWWLSRGFRAKLFGAYLLGFLVLLVPTIAITWITSSVGIAALGAVQQPASPFTLPPMTMIGLASRLVIALLQILIYPFLYVVTTVLYYDLRVRKEGFDLEMLASSLNPV